MYQTKKNILLLNLFKLDQKFTRIIKMLKLFNIVISYCAVYILMTRNKKMYKNSIYFFIRSYFILKTDVFFHNLMSNFVFVLLLFNGNECCYGNKQNCYNFFISCSFEARNENIDIFFVVFVPPLLLLMKKRLKD